VKMLRLRIDEDTLQQVDARAEALGLSREAYCRRAILDADIRSKIDEIHKAIVGQKPTEVTDAEAALVHLGWLPAKARRIVEGLPPDLDTDTLVAEALRHG